MKFMSLFIAVSAISAASAYPLTKRDVQWTLPTTWCPIDANAKMALSPTYGPYANEAWWDLWDGKESGGQVQLRQSKKLSNNQRFDILSYGQNSLVSLRFFNTRGDLIPLSMVGVTLTATAGGQPSNFTLGCEHCGAKNASQCVFSYPGSAGQTMVLHAAGSDGVVQGSEPTDTMFWNIKPAP